MHLVTKTMRGLLSVLRRPWTGASRSALHLPEITRTIRRDHVQVVRGLDNGWLLVLVGEREVSFRAKELQVPDEVSP